MTLSKDAIKHLRGLLKARHSPHPWQRSRFVDRPSYGSMPYSWKAERVAEEKKIIRGPGQIGETSCAAVGRFDGPDIELVIAAVNALEPLLDEVEMLRAAVTPKQESLEISPGERRPELVPPPAKAQIVLVVCPGVFAFKSFIEDVLASTKVAGVMKSNANQNIVTINDRRYVMVNRPEQMAGFYDVEIEFYRTQAFAPDVLREIEGYAKRICKKERMNA